MNLDELAQSIPNEDSDKRNNLITWIEEWKASDKDVNELSAMIDKWHGNIWFNNQESQRAFFNHWVHFKHVAIEQIGGMTMNERLYWFGLFEHFGSSDDESKLIIYKKLLASP